MNSGICEKSSKSQQVKNAILATQIILAFTFITCLVSSIVSISYTKFIWVIIGQFQLLMYLLLTKAYIPKLIADYIVGIDYIMFSFNFIKWKEWLFINFIEWIDYQQPQEMLRFIKIHSGSALINNISLFFIISIIIIIHAIVVLLFKVLSKIFTRWDRSCSKFKFIWSSIENKRYFTFSILYG